MSVKKKKEKQGEMRTAAAFRCLSQLGGNWAQTVSVWGAVRGIRPDTDAGKCNKEEKKEKNQRKDRNL